MKEAALGWQRIFPELPQAFGVSENSPLFNNLILQNLFAPTSLPWLKSFFAMGVTPLQRSLANKNIPDWNLWDIFEHKLNVYAGKSFFYGGKELGVGRLLLVP